ncbi:MAG: cellulase family glycosylhydrolase [Anaerolineae bacterium]
MTKRRRGGVARALWPWLFALTIVILLGGCVLPQADARPATITTPSDDPASSSQTPTVPSTITPYPTPTPWPTPLPTIVIPMLTQTAPLTTTPEAASALMAQDLWHLPEPIVPEGLGVEIHFTGATQGEMNYLAQGGFKWVRKDLFWHTVETAYGHYDFSEYDALVESMRRRGIRMIFILDYGNPLYDHGFPPSSPGGQDAFARFAAVAARRYHDAGVIWDIWNEPNLDHFWPPKADPEVYGRLIHKTVAAIRRGNPTALIAGPALCGYDWDYWRVLGEMNVFDRLDAVTVHSYGVHQPEGLIEPLLMLRRLIDEYSANPDLPILSGEWGFSSSVGGWTEGQQAELLARQWLLNLAYDINLSVWYDWRDNGTDPYNAQHHFGTIDHHYNPKPAYRAASTLTTALRGYRYLRRVPLESAEDYLLLFQNGPNIAMAIWTVRNPHTILLPVSVLDVEVVSMLGEARTVPSEGQGLAITISTSPQYLRFRADQAVADLGGWRPARTIHSLRTAEAATIPVIFDRHQPGTLHGELEVWAQGREIGRLPVVVPAMEHEQIRVPVDVTGLHGDIPAEVRLAQATTTMAPMQSAMIWIQAP